MSEALKVAVRCRPFNQREIDRDAKLVIDMVGATTIIRHPDSGEEKKFTFDYSYWSHDGFETDENGYMRPSNDKYADQTKVFNDLGVGLLNNAWNGFNCCVFAYGQTGSGKSYSIVGYGENKGIIPLTCSDLFRRIADTQTDQLNYRVQVTMLEIYNEKLRDLLNPKTAADQLKIRTSAAGMYVENIREVAVDSYESIEKQMDVGTKNRTVGATQMNATSSRAHTVFTINFTKIDTSGGAASELRAALNLVDLAGSERANSTGATGDRLKEGAAINQSLSNLGLVISALAEQANNPKKKVLVPYRASKLTLLLQNALGGNSKTVMVAALSPADINYEETLSTLRYADRAKQIKTVATIQENPTDKLIRELREENERLQKLVSTGGSTPRGGPTDAGQLNMVTPEEMRAAVEETVSSVGKVSKEEQKAAVQKTLDKYKDKYPDGATIPDEDMMQIVTDAIYFIESLSDAEKAQTAEATKQAANWRNGGRFRYLLIGQQKSLAKARFGDAIARTLLKSASRKGALYAAIEAVRRQKAVEDVKSAREQLEANEKKIAMLQMSWEQQLEMTKKMEAERSEAMKAMGIEDLTKEQMQETPSLVNMSDDPLMTGKLIYWLRSDELTMGAAQDSAIVLQGIGVSEHHAKIVKKDGGCFLVPVKGTTFMNGAEVKGETKMDHNARLIIGNSNVLRFNDPVTAAKMRAEGGGAKQIIDWDFAQKELSDALGATVSLKVEEEIAKEKAALDAKSKELEERFAKERDEMAQELERLRAQGSTVDSSMEEQKLKDLEAKVASVGAFRKQREAAIATYRRDLIRLEETLVRLNPVVGESNAMAKQMGRRVEFAIKLVTNIPEAVSSSPLEELWSEKTTECMVRATLYGHTDEVKRHWLWTVDEFYDRVFMMRDQFTLYLRGKTDEVAPRRSTLDPFWAPPKPEVIGKAFLYLTPVAHRAATSDWLPIVDITGKTQGELKVSLKCTESNYVDVPAPVADPSVLLGEPLHFTLRVDGARGLIGDVTEDTFVRFNFSDEDTPRTTDVCEGRTATPQYSFKENFDVEEMSQKMLDYLQSDAICFEVWGQAQEVAEGQAQATQVEQPPEIFDFFVALDIHESETEVRGDSWVEAAWEKGMTRDGKPALYITQNRARRLVISVSQQQSVFMVSRFAHVWLGNLRDEYHEVWDASFIPLTIISQSRVGDRFQLVCDWISQFEMLNQAAAAGKVFYFDVKLECTELERLVLEEPVILTRRLNVRVEETLKQPAAGVLGVGGLLKKGQPAATRRIIREGDGKGIVADPDRLKRLEEHQQHYMGSWDITGEAVDIAMASLKSSAVADTGKEIKKQLHEMDEGLRALSARMLDEQSRQLDALSKALAKTNAEAAAVIAEKSRVHQEKQDATKTVLEVSGAGGARAQREGRGRHRAASQLPLLIPPRRHPGPMRSLPPALLPTAPRSTPSSTTRTRTPRATPRPPTRPRRRLRRAPTPSRRRSESCRRSSRPREDKCSRTTAAAAAPPPRPAAARRRRPRRAWPASCSRLTKPKESMVYRAAVGWRR